MAARRHRLVPVHKNPLFLCTMQFLRGCEIGSMKRDVSNYAVLTYTEHFRELPCLAKIWATRFTSSWISGSIAFVHIF